ncbi:MAG: hypothetical protein IPJ65_14755 [Archangiaceae bacterium]|nr:hypothetical protein [Archangiaceae bacterium]
MHAMAADSRARWATVLVLGLCGCPSASGVTDAGAAADIAGPSFPRVLESDSGVTWDRGLPGPAEVEELVAVRFWGESGHRGYLVFATRPSQGGVLDGPRIEASEADARENERELLARPFYDCSGSRAPVDLRAQVIPLGGPEARFAPGLLVPGTAGPVLSTRRLRCVIFRSTADACRDLGASCRPGPAIAFELFDGARPWGQFRLSSATFSEWVSVPDGAGGATGTRYRVDQRDRPTATWTNSVTLEDLASWD